MLLLYIIHLLRFIRYYCICWCCCCCYCCCQLIHLLSCIHDSWVWYLIHTSNKQTDSRTTSAVISSSESSSTGRRNNRHCTISVIKWRHSLFDSQTVNDGYFNITANYWKKKNNKNKKYRILKNKSGKKKNFFLFFFLEKLWIKIKVLMW